MTQAPDPFAPPKAELGAGRAPDEPGSALKAVLVAFLVNVALSFVLGIVLVVTYGAFLAATGNTMEEIVDLVSTATDHTATQILVLVIDGGCAILGGILCARIARHSEYRLGAILAVLLAATAWIMAWDDQDKALLLATMIVSILATMFGAWIGARLNRRGR